MASESLNGPDAIKTIAQGLAEDNGWEEGGYSDVIGHLPIPSLSKLNIFQSVRLGKDIFRFSHRFSF